MIIIPENTPDELVELMNWIDLNAIPANLQARQLDQLEKALVKYKIPLRMGTYPTREVKLNIPDRLIALLRKYDVTTFPGYKFLKTPILNKIQLWIYKNLPVK